MKAAYRAAEEQTVIRGEQYQIAVKQSAGKAGLLSGRGAAQWWRCAVIRRDGQCE